MRSDELYQQPVVDLPVSLSQQAPIADLINGGLLRDMLALITVKRVG